MELPEQSQLTLWQNYCDKKVECEEWKAKFKQTLDMLEYAHITGEWAYDHKGVSKFIEEMYKSLKGK